MARRRHLSIICILLASPFVGALGQQAVYSNPLGAGKVAQAQKVSVEEAAPDLLNPGRPTFSISPDGNWMLLIFQQGLLHNEQLEEPIVALAGQEFDPVTYGPRKQRLLGTALFLVEIATHDHWVIQGAPTSQIGEVLWAPDSQRFSFLHEAKDRVELWTGNARTKKARRVSDVSINAASYRIEPTMSPPCLWLSDSERLLCQEVVNERPFLSHSQGGLPQISDSDNHVPESVVSIGAVITQEDEARYRHYLTSQPILLNIRTGEKHRIAPARRYLTFDPSPNAKYILAVAAVEPFSHYALDSEFAKSVDVFDTKGRLLRHVLDVEPFTGSDKRLEDVPEYHSFQWRPDRPASLAYVEAANGKDGLLYNDRLMELGEPFSGPRQELLKLGGRAGRFFGPIWWGGDGLAMVTVLSEQNHRQYRIVQHNLGDPRTTKDVWLVGAPMGECWPVEALNSVGRPVILRRGDLIYLWHWVVSNGRYLRRIDTYDLRSGTISPVYTSAPGVYETPRFGETRRVFLGISDKILVSRETREQPTEFFVYSTASRNQEQIFRMPLKITNDGIQREQLRYVRSDGVSLFGDLYLPPNYESTSRPVIMWGYPTGYSSKEAAESGYGASDEYQGYGCSITCVLTLLAHRGYIVLDAHMPIIGDRLANDSYIDQLVADAGAAVTALVARGVARPGNVAVLGHSYGGLMVENLLAHSGLFVAGIALNGYSNLTDRPFGFQSEGRTLWQAPKTYEDMSPLFHADRITAPLLLIHGGKDTSEVPPGQDEQLFRAVSGLGGKVRFVTLPLEGHTFAAVESWEVILSEVTRWLDIRPLSQ